MSFPAELWRFMRGPQEVLAAADHHRDGAVRRAARPGAGLGRRAVHLHAVLTGRACASSASPPSTTTAPPRWSRRRDRRRGAGGALHAQEARRRLSRATPIAYCLREAGIALDDVDHVAFYDKPFLKFERLLETYLAFAPRGFTSFRMAMPVWLKEKLFQKSLLRKELEDARRPTSTGTTQAAVRRAPPEPRRERVLPVAVRGGGRADDGRRRRVGDDLGRRSGEGNELEMHARRSTSRIRSACSTPPSPTTPASRSTPASTR